MPGFTRKSLRGIQVFYSNPQEGLVASGKTKDGGTVTIKHCTGPNPERQYFPPKKEINKK